MSEPVSEWRTRMREFYGRIGYCVTRWAYIERDLCALTKWSLAANDPLAAFVFHQWSSFDNKLSFVDGLLARTASAPFKPKWRAIHTQIKALARDRNFIVHQPPLQSGSATFSVSLETQEATMLERSEPQWLLRTEPLEIKAGKRQAREFTESELVTHGKALDDLLWQLHSFSTEIACSPRRFAKSLEPKAPQKTGRAKNRLAKRQAQQRQRSPSRA